MKAVFFGTPDFAVPTLNALNEICDVTLVVTREDKKKGRGKKLLPTPVKTRAEALGIEIFQPHSCNTKEALEKLRAQEADLFVVVAYGQILSEDVLTLPKKYIVNVHSSLLPKYRGAAPMQWAILNGDEETGVSLMKVEAGLDSGPVYAMKKTTIGDKNFGIIHDELAEFGAHLVREFVTDLEKGTVTFTEQDHDAATYAAKIDDELLALHADELTAKEFVRKIRAFSPEPGAHFLFRDERLKVYDGEVSDEKVPTGHYKATKKKLWIGTKDGAVLLKEIQRPGKKRMAIGSYLAGAHLDEKGEI